MEKHDINTKVRVALSVGLLVGAKVSPRSILVGSSLYLTNEGFKCPSAFLLQEHR